MSASGDPAPTSIPPHPRLTWVLGMMGAALLVLLVTLAYRQLVRAPDYAQRERRQNFRRVLEPAPRGAIHDRERRVLAGNRPVVSAVVWLGDLRGEIIAVQEAARERSDGARGAGGDKAKREFPGRSETGPTLARNEVVRRHLERVNALTQRHATLDADRLEQAFARDRTIPFVLAEDLEPEESDRLRAGLVEGSPVQLQTTYRRVYPEGRTASHVLGRLRPEVLRRPDGPDMITLNARDVAGDSGLEHRFNASLQGEPGEGISAIDALGFRVEAPRDHRAPVPGQDLVLSLDLELQRTMERTMAAVPGARGAAVALDIATGEVLALASMPDFDLSEVSPLIAPAVQQRLDAAGAWLNRATQGLYPPGSSFKIFTALAALRGGTLHPEDAKRCPGYHDVAGHRFRCHNPAGHGELALTRALAQSCNVFAYQAGLDAGPEALAAEARRFHFDRPTGLELPSEARGMLVADPAWKQQQRGVPWTDIDTANFAIGQGFLRYSPLQAACAVASLARRETLTVPTLLRSPGRRPTGGHAPEPLGLSEADYTAVLAGMEAVVARGIGRDAQVPGIRIAGKTGTAQVERPEGRQNVAWFVAFAPVEKPAIAIAVAMEGPEPGVEFAGAEHAAPVVREVLARYFSTAERR